jgi:D-3-phosphoglycerate dehydrogenase
MGLGHDPEGKVLGILGMGGIGTAMAKRAAGFQMNIQYHNRTELPADQNPVNAKYVSFEELLRTSDVISVHVPLSQATTHLISREQFAMMKDGAIVINTARGAVIDEAAMVEALESGKLFSVGLDVYEKEPEIHQGLVNNDKVVLAPHIGTATFETQVRTYPQSRGCTH